MRANLVVCTLGHAATATSTGTGAATCASAARCPTGSWLPILVTVVALGSSPESMILTAERCDGRGRWWNGWQLIRVSSLRCPRCQSGRWASRKGIVTRRRCPPVNPGRLGRDQQGQRDSAGGLEARRVATAFAQFSDFESTYGWLRWAALSAVIRPADGYVTSVTVDRPNDTAAGSSPSRTF